MVKIASVEAENVKRVKAVYLEPKADGLTVIGGRNGQGKTSVLDAIAWALGGDKMRPSNAKREDAAGDPQLRVVLDNGIVVERKGKNSSLKVIDPSGNKGGQQLLNSFTEQLALNLPRFMQATDKEKAETLLSIMGVGEELAALDAQKQTAYNQRLAVGQMERQKRGAANDMRHWPDAPAQEVSASELIAEQSAILARNGENQRKRMEAQQVKARLDAAMGELARMNEQSAELARRMAEKSAEVERLSADAAAAAKTAEQLRDESTAELEAQLAEVEAVNDKVRTNMRRAAAMAEADELKAQYDELDERVRGLQKARTDLLRGAKLPLEGLAVEFDAKGEPRLEYQGQPWDCMSGSEQLKAATAIVRELKPECGFVLVDKLEQMDPQTLAEFGQWAEGEGLQVIGTRVGTGGECSLVIEDGRGQLGDPEGDEERMVAESLRECAADSGCQECTIPRDGTCAPAAAKGWVIQ